MIDAYAKTYLHDELRWIREAVLSKLDGLSEYDVRRPMTATGTNLLGLVKHLSFWEARYFGEVFGRPFPEPLPGWDDESERGADLWATEHETRAEIIDRYRRVWDHAGTTISNLDIDASGYVPWWPSPDVKLFNVLVHMIGETSRHAGHADILREQIDGAVGLVGSSGAGQETDSASWENRRSEIERAARAARPEGVAD